MGLNYGPIFSPFVNQSSPDYVSRRRRDCSLQCHFPIVNILFHSGDIRDRSARSSKIMPKKHVFGPQIFLGGGPQIMDLLFKIAPISDHVAKFHGDWPRDRGDLTLLKKKNSSKTGRPHCVIATGGPNKRTEQE